MNAATEQFRSGRYEDAMNLLQRTIDRNKRYAARMPGKISDLYATHADVAAHFGRRSAYMNSTWSSTDVLRKYAGKTSIAALTTRPRIGDMLALQGRASAADEIYASAAHDAAANGQRQLAAQINFRRAWLMFNQGNNAGTARFLDEIAKEMPNDPQIATLVRALRVRIAIRRKQDAVADQLLAEWRTAPGEAPVLISEPPPPVFDTFDPTTMAMNPGIRESPRDYRWVDIGYWVRPWGTTEQVEILRPDNANEWAKPFVKVIAKRRYVPLAQNEGSPGVYRIDRYSLRRELDVDPGVKRLIRVGHLKIIQTDMTRTQDSETLTSNPPETMKP